MTIPVKLFSRLNFFILLLCGIGIQKSVNAQESKVNWKKDIQYLKKELPKQHKNLFSKITRESFNTSLDSITTSMEQYQTDIEKILAIQEQVIRIGDAHTGLGFYQILNPNYTFPIQVKWFADGPFISSIAESNGAHLGKKISAIGHIPWKEVVARLSALFVIDNEACILNSIPPLLPYGEVLKYYGLANCDSVCITVSDKNNHMEDVWLYSRKLVPFSKNNLLVLEPIKKNLIYKKQKEIFWFDYNEMDSLLYFQYNKCWSRELELIYGNKQKAGLLPSFNEIVDSLFLYINNGRVKNFVIDFRFNAGGSSLQGSQLAAKVAGNEKINRKGKLYIVTGRKTFSSAVINVMDFKKATHAIIIGEPTEGKPNHFGEVRSFKLPNSGLKVFYSTKYFYSEQGNVDSIYPDIDSRETFDFYMQGIDPVLQTIIGL